jgi:hypothetical protein
MNTENTYIPEAVGMSQMAKLLHLSRSRLYQLIEHGVLLNPVYLITNKRPIYTREMAMRNLEVKKNNVGVNGQVIMFYSPRNIIHSGKINAAKAVEKKLPTNQYKELIEELGALGLEEVSGSDVGAAISELFPDGTEKVSDDEILTSVFRHIKCRDTTDNVER